MAKIAKTVKNDLSTLKQSCVGKKMKGFKFADCKSAHWCSEMEDFIGQEGEIIAYHEAWNYFTVKFTGDKGYWAYPATKALKHVVEDSDVVIENVTEEEIDDAYVKMLKEEIEDLSAKLDISYREQEQMLSELNRNVERMKFHCKTVEDETGKLTREDVDYCANLLNRIMRNKFEFKPKNWE